MNSIDELIKIYNVSPLDEKRKIVQVMRYIIDEEEIPSYAM